VWRTLMFEHSQLPSALCNSLNAPFPERKSFPGDVSNVKVRILPSGWTHSSRINSFAREWHLPAACIRYSDTQFHARSRGKSRLDS
jgi:hypothetical protein